MAERVFECIITKVNYKRKAGGDTFDGLAYWHRMKAILNKLPATVYEWVIDYSAVDGDRILQLPECDEHNIIILNNHCIRQLIRIPREKPCCIMRVMHIAFNIGQFTALKESNYATLVMYGLEHINSYVDECVLHLLDQIIVKHPSIIDELLSLA
jgi:hypothetical protein